MKVAFGRCLTELKFFPKIAEIIERLPAPEPERAYVMSDEEAARELEKFQQDPACAEALSKWRALQDKFRGHTSRENRRIYQMLSEDELADRRKVLRDQAQQMQGNGDSN